MRPRLGLSRAFTASIALALLVVPVGTSTPSGPRPVSLPEALGELSRGRLGVGILSALVAGDAMTLAALFRLGLVLAAWAAFWLLGLLRRPEPVRQDDRRRLIACSACGFWTHPRMSDCPSCGVPLR